MPVRLIGIGDRVKVKGMMLGDEIDPVVSQYLGCYGTIISTDEDIMHSVLLDKYIENGEMVFLSSELEIIRTEGIILAKGGEVSNMYQPITPQYILALPSLSVYEKLCYFIVHFENPADYGVIMQYAGVTREFAKTVIKKLIGENLVVESNNNTGLFFAQYNIMPTVKKEKKEKEEKTTISEADKDILLFQLQLELYYHSRGVNHRVSKNGRKFIAKAVYFLEGQWAKRKELDVLREFEVRDDLYSAYIEHVFRGVDKNDLNQLKRLTYSGSKRGWTVSLSKPTYRFMPELTDKKFDNVHFYGIKKSDIPKDVEKSGYWATYKIFLGSRWTEGTYPVSKQVLYALEMVIIFSLFRKAKPGGTEIGMLINIHGKYLKEYTRAVACKKLDNLADFVTNGAKKSDVCYDCLKNDTCPTYNSSAIVVNCTQKVLTDGG
jgi:hypothetical protein